MTIKINNEPREIAESSTIADILAEFPQEGTATALNGRIVNRDARPTTILHEGDEVIVVSAAYGG